MRIWCSLWVSQNMNTKKCLIMNAFFRYNLIIVPLTWMFHNRLLNHKLNSLHEIFLRIIYNVSLSSYDEWFNLGNSVSVHHKKLQILVTEMYTWSATNTLNEVLKLQLKKCATIHNKTYENCILWYYDIWHVNGQKFESCFRMIEKQ